MSIERRSLPRYSCRLRASIALDGQRFDATCLDLGPGGGYLATELMPSPGTELSVGLASPQGRTMVVATADVMYTVHRSSSRPPGVALRWHEITSGLRRLIEIVSGARPERETPAQAKTPAARLRRIGPNPTTKNEKPSVRAAEAQTAPYKSVPIPQADDDVTRRDPGAH